jgi:hypothetical protein
MMLKNKTGSQRADLKQRTLQLGKRTPFTPAQVKRFGSGLTARRANEHPPGLAMFSRPCRPDILRVGCVRQRQGTRY